MTYKLNPALKNIESPVILIINGNKKEYENGEQLTNAVFTKNYDIQSIRAVNNSIEIELKEREIFPVNWTGEEQTFF